MTIKTFSTKSNANRALKKAVAGLEDFILSSEIKTDAEGHYGFVLLNQQGRGEVQDALTAKGLRVMVQAAPIEPVEAPALAAQTEEGPVAAEGSEEADAASLAEMLALTEAPAEVEYPSEEAVASNEFEAAFTAAGGRQPRGICKALRIVAAKWDGSHKEFVAAAVAAGLNKANASIEFFNGRKAK